MEEEEEEARANDEKKRLIREKERGAKLLEDLIECCNGKPNPIKFFSAGQILEAIDNFNESNHIEFYSHGFKWYPGTNKNHHMFIKKIILFVSFNNFEPVCRDLAISSMVSAHKNFMKLVGCCLESEDPSLVYHGVNKHYRLYLSEQPWKRRMKIAEDIATALAYLHTAFPRPFVYINMNLEKILLDEDGVAKLFNFSHCVLIPKGETFVTASKYDYKGFGFDEPNYKENKVVSEKTDVFGIGILMQKLLSGEERFRDLCLEGEEVEYVG